MFVTNNQLLDLNDMAKIILFGGTFDPVHIGHVTVAGFARDKTCADQVVMIPAKQSPHKKVSPMACDRYRFEMLQLAVEGMTGFCVSDCEITRGLPSYTIDTVKYFHDQFPQAKLYWLVGADAVGSLHRWHRIDELVEFCTLSVMYRAGFGLPDMSLLKSVLSESKIKELEQNIIETPLIDASSTLIRQYVADGREFDHLLDKRVAEYIKKNTLYR